MTKSILPVAAPKTCECRECEAEFPTPAVGQCPSCGSRKIQRVEDTNERKLVRIAQGAIKALAEAEATLLRHDLRVPAVLMRARADEIRTALGQAGR